MAAPQRGMEVYYVNGSDALQYVIAVPEKSESMKKHQLDARNMLPHGQSSSVFGLLCQKFVVS